MNVYDLITKDGYQLKRKTSTEYAGACHFCGGEDRCIVQPEKGPTGRYWCRQCGKSGDAIDYLRDIRGLSYREACEVLNIQPKGTYRPGSTTGTIPKTKWEPRTLEIPSDLWQAQARAFVDQAVKNLWGEYQSGEPLRWKRESAKVRRWLVKDRGLSEQIIREAGLGWNPRDFFPPRKLWSLPDKDGDGKTITKMFLPKGLVIPYRQDGWIVKVKIRRPEPGDGQRYILLSGSDTRSMALQGTIAGGAAVVVESELDALLLWDRCRDLVTTIALGSAGIRPDKHTDQLLKQAETILVALDSDQAGAKESWQWWAGQYPNSKRWPPVKGKDPGEMLQAGVDIRFWVQAGLLKEAPGQAEANKDKRNQKSEGLSIAQNKNGQPRRDSLDYEREMDTAIAEFNRLHVDPMAVPVAKRKEAMQYERLLTQAANENRPDEFMEHLERWRGCFH